MLANEFFASKDDGQTWNLVNTLPDGHYDAIGLILTERAFYAAFDSEFSVLKITVKRGSQ